MILRELEPEVMDTADEAADYDSMNHDTVNRAFVADLLDACTQREIAQVRPDSRHFRVLDVGTGTALIPLELCRQSNAFHILGVDMADEMLKVGQRNVDRSGLNSAIELQLSDAKSLPFDDASFELVTSNSIIHHIPQPRQVFDEMTRVLRPGGLLFVRDLLRPDSHAQVEDLVKLYAGTESPRQQQLFRQSLRAALSLEEVRQMVSDPQSVQTTSDRHWTLIWQRLT